MRLVSVLKMNVSVNDSVSCGVTFHIVSRKKFWRSNAWLSCVSRAKSSAVKLYAADRRYVGRSYVMAMPGVKPVMKSETRLRLSRRTLSLYSSVKVIDGVMVIGARRVGCSPCGSGVDPGRPGCWKRGHGAAAGAGRIRERHTTPHAATCFMAQTCITRDRSRGRPF